MMPEWYLVIFIFAGLSLLDFRAALLWALPSSFSLSRFAGAGGPLRLGRFVQRRSGLVLEFVAAPRIDRPSVLMQPLARLTGRIAPRPHLLAATRSSPDMPCPVRGREPLDKKPPGRPRSVSNTWKGNCANATGCHCAAVFAITGI